LKIKKFKKVITVILLGITIFSIGCAGQSRAFQPSGTPGPSSKATSWPEPPAMQIDKNKQYFAAVETTLGSFKIQLFTRESPLAVNNFVFLSRQGFYNGVIFHRIIKDFMIQTGDPQGTGAGGPGYKFTDELPPKHPYDPGIVAMANSGPNTNGSQFFICTGQGAHGLDNPPYNAYTQFGQVVEGMDVVMKIASVPVGPNPYNPREISKPNNPPAIKSITITE
jgi:cyclophilin family peptidyl-prolyl cis-trans isomerase